MLLKINLTNGPMKNTCKQSATGKHVNASCIQSVNQLPLNPLWKNVAKSVMAGTIIQTVKHWIARIRKMGLSTPSVIILKASFLAHSVITKKINRNTTTYSIHISLIASANTLYVSPPDFMAMV